MVPNSQAFHRDPFLLSPFRGPVVLRSRELAAVAPVYLPADADVQVESRERKKRERDREFPRYLTRSEASLNEYLSQKTPELGHSLQRERFVCSR